MKKLIVCIVMVQFALNVINGQITDDVAEKSNTETNESVMKIDSTSENSIIDTTVPSTVKVIATSTTEAPTTTTPITTTSPASTTTLKDLEEELIPPADVSASIALMDQPPKKKPQIIIRY